MSDQPKWTLSSLMNMVDAPEQANWYSALTKIADARNAELDAEREKTRQCAIEGSGWKIEAQQLRSQLAEETRRFESAAADSYNYMKQLSSAQDALTEIRDKSGDPKSHRIAYECLAKVKEGK